MFALKLNVGKALSLLILVSLLVIACFVQVPTVDAVDGPLWDSQLSGTKILDVRSIPDIDGDGHEDIFAVTNSTNAGMLYLINGMSGSVIRNQAITFQPKEALYIESPIRIAVAYSSGIKIYNVLLNEIATFSFANPLRLQTFTGNEILFYYDSGGTWGSWTIKCYSLQTLSQLWEHVVSSALGSTNTIRDMLVLNSNRVMVIATHDDLTSHYWYVDDFDRAGGETIGINFAGTATSNSIALNLYNGTHFLYSIKTTSGTSLRLSQIFDTNSSENIYWDATIWNVKGNHGHPIIDVNGDGANDVVTILGGNLALLNGATGTSIYTIGEIFGSNITDVAIVDDMNNDGLNDVAINILDKTYLVSFKPSTYSIIWEQTFGSEGISAIQDINNDSYKDLIAGTGIGLTCFVGSAVPPPTSTPIPSPTPTASPSPSPSPSPTPVPTSFTITPTPSPTVSPTLKPATPAPTPIPTLISTATPVPSTPIPTPVETQSGAFPIEYIAAIVGIAIIVAVISAAFLLRKRGQ